MSTMATLRVLRARTRRGCVALGLTLFCILAWPAARAACVSHAATSAPLTEADVTCAIARFEPLLTKTMRDTGVPGVAVGVVFDDRLLWSAGYGVREVGKPEPIDDHSLFQLASVSKPIGATLVARLVGEGHVRWDDPVVRHKPNFALADPWVTAHVTLADLYSHRSGLPDHAGEDLDEIGYSRAEVIERLRHEKLANFRADYAYTNYGLTAAAEAATDAIGLSWEDASRDLLYRPAGMLSTTSRFSEYMASPLRAVPHVRRQDKTWAPDFQQEPDGESPAAGVASNVVDMARWMRLHLNGGQLDGQQLIDPVALAATHTPHALTRAPIGYTARADYYGLGWFINVDSLGQVRWSHAGSFALGGATTVNLVPAHGLGIVILTNGFPIGLPEAMAEVFLDLVFFGAPTVDWFALYKAEFEKILYPRVNPDYRIPPLGATPPRAFADYAGTYQNAYYGAVSVVSGADGGLVLLMGPARRAFPLGHYSGDTFWLMPPGEFGVVPAAATFTFPASGSPRLAIPKFSSSDHGALVRRDPPPAPTCDDRAAPQRCRPR